MSTPIEREALDLSRRLCLALAEMISPPALALFYAYDAVTTAMNCREITDQDLYEVIIQEAHEATAVDVLSDAESIAEGKWQETSASGDSDG